MNFFDQVYELTRQIPPGKVTTYGELARALGTRDARRVGHALHANPFPWQGSELLGSSEPCSPVPCHRVVAKDGRLSPSYAFGGSLEQHAKLVEEGVTFTDREHVDLDKHLWVPESL